MSHEEKDRRPEEILQNLAKRLGNSSTDLDKVAGKIKQAADQQLNYQARMAKLNRDLKNSLSPISRRKATYLEYLEFSSAREFKRFHNVSPITQTDIESVNWDELTHELLAS